jgi:hypothetical protein
MVRHNNQIPNQHFKKHWHGGKNGKGSLVRTWFNQPARKLRRASGALIALMSVALNRGMDTLADFLLYWTVDNAWER